MLYLLELYWCSIIYWWWLWFEYDSWDKFTPLKVNEVLFEVCIVSEGKWSIIWGLYCMWRKWSVLINAACHIHCMIHLHLKLGRDLRSDRTGTISIVRCPRRGTMWLHTLRGMKTEDICIAFICIHWSDICIWCGFISSEVWRQRIYILHSYAYIEVILAGIVDAEKCYTTYCGCSRKWDGIGYIGTTEFYIYKYFWS
jgi:hypothetical protein